MQGDCENAIRSFTNYLERFPNGIFSLNAHFYRSECEFRRNNFNQAMAGYREVIARPKSKFSENALSRASQIEFRQGNYEQALEYFIKPGRDCGIPGQRAGSTYREDAEPAPFGTQWRSHRGLTNGQGYR
jgi:tetratricopeptide (TPR) repeat protein